jgi:hypothetical protein
MRTSYNFLIDSDLWVQTSSQRTRNRNVRDAGRG